VGVHADEQRQKEGANATEGTGQQVYFPLEKEGHDCPERRQAYLQQRGVAYEAGSSADWARWSDGAPSDQRQEGKVLHSLRDGLRERLSPIAVGYEDINDVDTLIFDPGPGLTGPGSGRASAGSPGSSAAVSAGGGLARGCVPLVLSGSPEQPKEGSLGL
jgi:hypothetical protein